MAETKEPEKKDDDKSGESTTATCGKSCGNINPCTSTCQKSAGHVSNNHQCGNGHVWSEA